jgi:hypothetical protein
VPILDPSGWVVVIEVKGAVDRDQLAQALEYAGWARGTSLDEFARLFHGGEAGRAARGHIIHPPVSACSYLRVTAS